MLKEKSFDENSQIALENLSASLDPTSNVDLMQEFDDLFYSPFSSNIRLTASYYDEGVESGKKRLEMLQFIGKTNRINLNLEGSELITVMNIEKGINPSDKVSLEIKFLSTKSKES